MTGGRYIYIYIERERGESGGREIYRKRGESGGREIYIYIYIYIYIEREREREREVREAGRRYIERGMRLAVVRY